ncbi:MAG: hypothetical protein DRJ09_05095 [Bacteroidetes bacterium]|nr:MAG: hypothetical protein DRJ09_05095 [Bacteroidota bacterium]
MKSTLLILSLLITINLYSSEVDTLILNSKIKNVTVFFDGAQVTREAKINIPEGKHLLILEKLPAEITPQSIQIENNQKGEILSVKHEITFPSQENEIISTYKDSIKQQEIKIKEIKNKISVYEIEEKILLDNSILNKKGESSNIAEIKEASAFYRTKLNEIRHNKLKLTIEIDLVKKKIQNLYKNLNKKISQEQKSYSKISFAIDCKTAINSNFNISYYVSSAGWIPLYDFRVNDIREPLNIVYNASIYQSTGEDWKNVNLTLSTNRPSLNNSKPELATWFISERNSNKTKNIIDGQSALKGIITDQETGEPIPFVNIIVYKEGKMIAGSTSDFDGRYTIKPIKSGSYDIRATFIGYNDLEMKGVVLNANKITFQDFKMKESNELLEEVQIVEYNVPLVKKDKTSSGTTVTANEILKMPRRSERSVASTVGGTRGSRGEVSDFYPSEINTINSNVIDKEYNITSLEYKIKIPYTIPSDGNDYYVRIKEVEKPVSYVYYSIPKLEKDVFLMAEISNWAKLNLLSGKSSIYYKGTYTGRSFIDATSTKDTLEISLSRDKNIIVERTLLKEKNKKQFIGRNAKETINRSIVIRNNKSEKVKIIIEDQFPISEDKSIEIEKLEYSNGKVNNKTGQVIWELELKPNEKKELILKYSIKYPKYLNLSIE